MADRFTVDPVQDLESHAALVDHSRDGVKSSQDCVAVEDVPTGIPSPRSGTLRWSGSQAGSEKGSLFRTSTIKIKNKTGSTFSKTGTWTYEVIGLFLAAVSVAGIIAVLAYFDGRAVPDWPIDITLSALVALLATIANANLAAPIQSSLSQLKWIRFKTGRTPLMDMEIYDEASRGTWGALKLICTLRGGVFGSFGAVLTIVALALGPFAQQIASYRSHMIETPVGASIPRALNYTGYLPGKSSSNGFVPILPMKSAVYNGLFAENGAPASALNVTCATGNCTFEPFETLAICYKCVDMTPYMSRYCQDGTPADGNSTSCGWQLTDGSGSLNKSTDVFSMSSSFPSAYGNMPYATIMKLTFMGTESQTVADVLNPWSLQCSLSACIQELNSTVKNGYVKETIINSHSNTTVVDISNAQADIPISLTSRSTNNTFLLAMGAKLAMESWFSELFQPGFATRSVSETNYTVSDTNVIVNLTVGVASGETFFDTDIVTAFYWNYYEYPGGIELLMADLAISMTTAMRSFFGAEPHAGLAWSWQAYVHVRWAFIALPVVVVLLTAAFLAATVWRTKQSGTKLWKSSALAMLFHGLDAESRERIGSGGDLSDKRRRASKLQVQLDDSSEAGSLLRV